MYIRNGQRETTARACLSKLTNHTNFYLMKNTVVTSVITAKDLFGIVTVTGVNVITNNSNCGSFQIKAKREVILSAGVHNTPKILLQSGIGRSSDLCSNVSQKISANVGYNYLDHVVSIHFFKVNESASMSGFLQSLNLTANLVLEAAKYYFTNTGYWSYLAGVNYHGLINTTNQSSPYPDIIFSFSRFDEALPDLNLMLNNHYGYKPDIASQISDWNQNSSILMVFVSLVKPLSRGTVKLRSCSDPNAAPIINANFMSNSTDTDTLLRGMKELQALMNTTTMRNFGVEDLKINITECNIYTRYSDSFNRCYLKYMTSGQWSTCGTCKMGKSSDSDAVVDKNLKVFGVTRIPLFTANLRVVDASVVPVLVMGDNQCEAFAIAEKAADMILADNLI